MTTSDDMFDGPVARGAASKRSRWRFVTSRSNLFYMLAAGLVMGPAGFGKKYYRDPLSLFPGWIPLFPDFVPRALIEMSVSERSHLRACLVEVDLERLQGPCMAIDGTGALEEVQFPAGLSGHEEALLVPAPLPASWIAHIGFETKEDKAQALADAEDFNNVALAKMRTKIEKRLFSRALPGPWPPAGAELPPRDQAPATAIAAGGVMAMLLHLANRGEIASRASRLAFEPAAVEDTSEADPMIRALPDWIRAGRCPETADVSARLFWGAVDATARARFQNPRPEPAAVVLNYLANAAAEMDERRRIPLERLANDLRDVTGLVDSTVTELFERHAKPFPRAMILFFLREKCSDLLEFFHPQLREQHFVLAAILFGARCGWLDLPLSLRDVPKLSNAVSHRMAAMTHTTAGTRLDLGPPAPRPRALRELLAKTEKGWTVKQKEAALVLARAGGWDCVQTRVTLGKGDYRMVVDGRGTQFVFPGEPKAVLTEVDVDQFFAHLTDAQPSVQAERKVRTLLDG